MEIMLKNTEKIVTVDGVRARVWEGTSAGGVEVVAFITRVAVAEGQPEAAYAEFERELRQVAPPSPVVEAIPARLIL